MEKDKNTDELQKAMLALLGNRFPIYLKDLTEEKQQEVLAFLGKFESEASRDVQLNDGAITAAGFDEFPIAIIERSYGI